MKKIKVFVSGVIFAFSAFMPQMILAEDTATAKVGKQFTDEKGAVWLVTDEGCRKAYTSRGAFESFGFNDFKSIAKGTTEDLAIPVCAEKFILPREGSVVFSSNKEDYGTGYLITNGKKRGFTSYRVFEGQGFGGKKKVFADVSFIQNGNPIASESESHPAGTLVDDQGTFKLVTEDGAIGIPSADTLKSWGYNFSDAVPANNADRQKPESSVLTSRGNGQLNGRELIERCIARQINGDGQTTGGSQPQVGNSGSGVGSTKPLPSNCPPPPCLRVLEGQNQNQGEGASNIFKPINCGVCEIKSGSSGSQSGTVKPNLNKEFVEPTKPNTENVISPNPPVQVKEKPGCLPPPCLYNQDKSEGSDNTKIKCVPPCPVLQNQIDNKNQTTQTPQNTTGSLPKCIPLPPPPCKTDGSNSLPQTSTTTLNPSSTRPCVPPCEVEPISPPTLPATSTEKLVPPPLSCSPTPKPLSK